jgi:hypothetical protein
MHSAIVHDAAVPRSNISQLTRTVGSAVTRLSPIQDSEIGAKLIFRELVADSILPSGLQVRLHMRLT